MPTILDKIQKWQNGLPYWEQYTLDLILRGIDLKEEHYEEIIKILLEDAGILKKKPRPKLKFFGEKEIIDAPQSDNIQLTAISNLQGVNALVEGQKLPLSPQLTAIYGANGSGKSGYARVLGCAGFSRGDQEVLPNVINEGERDLIQSASVSLIVDGHNSEFTYKIGEQCPLLSQFYVFDSTSVKTHLTGKNEFSFSPSLLYSLTNLAEAIDNIRTSLSKLIDEWTISPKFSELFDSESDIVSILESINSRTSISEIEKIATISDTELKSLAKYESQIAELRAKNYAGKIMETKQKIKDITELIENLSFLEDELSDNAIKQLERSLESSYASIEVAKLEQPPQVDLSLFKSKNSLIWNDFSRILNQIVNEENKRGKKYPSLGDHCLLCNQSLDKKSINQITNHLNVIKSKPAIIETNIKDMASTERNRIKKSGWPQIC